jgi:hypothetical protein
MYSPWESNEDGRERDLVRFSLRPEQAAVDVTRISMETVALRHGSNDRCFPRGLAVHFDLVAVGVSELSRRSGRRDTLGRVMLLSGIGRCSSTGSQAATVVDLGETGAVMDCRFVNSPDLGHPMPDGMAPPRCITQLLGSGASLGSDWEPASRIGAVPAGRAEQGNGRH